MNGTGTHEPDRLHAPRPWRLLPPVRTLGLKVILLVLFCAVALRLVQIQVIEAKRYQEIARRQHETVAPIPAMRGRIFDRNGVLLVSNAMQVSFAADPKIAGDERGAIADRFARVFERPRDEFLSRLTTTGRRFVWLERHVSPQLARRVNAAEFEGLIEISEPQRLYNYNHVAGQLIGFTDIDNKGLSGIELQEDRHLKGIDGQVVLRRDAIGHTRPSVDLPRIEPLNGKDVDLTIDVEYQAIAEEELRKGAEKNAADGGLVIMMDPRSGEILALANYPTLDVANGDQKDEDRQRNRAITDMFEPGSVFKIVTASAALERHAVKPEQKFNAENGLYTVVYPGGRTRTITDTHGFAALTFQEAIEQSSNIVFAKISDLVGDEGLYTMARNYGFGTETGIELPGEIGGELKKPSQWSGTTLNSIAYGYEVGVTPLQIITAYAALANDGVLMKPFVVRRVLGADGTVIDENSPEIVRRVVSSSTAAILKHMFEGVVQRGTGMAAAVRGVRIAGKTGTARKVVNGKYEMGSYTATFVGFLPADDPKVACLVMLDTKSAGAYSGGLASAPIFRSIAEKVYATSGRFAPKTDVMAGLEGTRSVPDVTGLKADAAREMLEDQGFAVRFSGNGEVVLSQSPAPGARAAAEAQVTVMMNSESTMKAGGMATVPDLRNLSMRRAINRLVANQLEADVSGSGIVKAQMPAAGQQVKTGTRVVLRCEPRPLVGPVVN